MHPSQQLKSNDMNYHNNIHQNYNKSDYPQEG